MDKRKTWRTAIELGKDVLIIALACSLAACICCCCCKKRSQAVLMQMKAPNEC